MHTSGILLREFLREESCEDETFNGYCLFKLKSADGRLRMGDLEGSPIHHVSKDRASVWACALGCLKRLA